MFELFKGHVKGRAHKLTEAIQQGELEQLNSLLNKLDHDQLNQPVGDTQSPAELAILANQPEALALIMKKGADANANSSTDEPLSALAMRGKHSLAMLTTLLSHGADPQATDATGRSLLQQCCQLCENHQLPLHLSRLQQQGVSLDSEPTLLVTALQQFDQPLIQFLINSGCPLPESLASDVPDEALRYAQRLVADYQIRQQFLQR